MRLFKKIIYLVLIILSTPNFAQQKKITTQKKATTVPTKKVDKKPGIVVKNQPIVLSQSQKDSIVIEKANQWMKSNQGFEVQWKVKSFEIIDRASNKQVKEYFNSIVQKNIDSIQQELVVLKKERAEIKAIIPEGYESKYSPYDEWDNNGKKIVDEFKPTYKKYLKISKQIVDGTKSAKNLTERLRGVSEEDEKYWLDEELNRYLCKGSLISDDGLDDEGIVYLNIRYVDESYSEIKRIDDSDLKDQFLMDGNLYYD